MGEVITAAKGAYEIYNLLQSAFPANDIIGKFRAEQAHKQEIQSIITAVDSAFAKLEEIDRSKAKDLIKEAASFWYDVVIPDILNSQFILRAVRDKNFAINIAAMLFQMVSAKHPFRTVFWTESDSRLPMK
jgi:hypothetical protein